MDDEKIKLDQYDTLVISGGGVKGFNILGAIQALYDANLVNNITTHVGTSIGAIISYLLAIGYTPIELVVSVYQNRCLERIQQFNLVAMINGNGATTFTPIYEMLEKMTLDKIGHLLTMAKLREELGKTLICTTYNMTTCRVEYLSPDTAPDLPCLTALRMTANIPLVFDRFRYMDNFYVDGGIADNFSIDKGIEYGKKVIGIYVDLNEKALQDNPEDGMMNYFFRLLQVPVIQSTRYKIESTKDKASIIRIKTTQFKNHVQFDVDSKSRLDMFSEGYGQVKMKI
uniref:PNPLA domain-containing protein n=1 Tax=viral metagenome TaxID=1070528 RepID=A0A6C0EM51_9ZZZZ